MIDAEERLRSLGKHLTELGSMPLLSFEEFVRVQLWLVQSNYVSLMENQLRELGGSPRFWAKDVKKCLDSLRGAVAKKEYSVPQDLLEGRSVDEARQLTQRIVFRFGQLLRWWPEIIEAAKSLRTQDRRLADRVIENEWESR
jgi:hypothetical protein